MKTVSLLKDLRSKLKGHLFSDEDLKLILLEKSPTHIHNFLSYHIKNQDIVKFKRGVYALTPQAQKWSFSPFVLAHYLYFPSYISFESALSFHALIPETVFEITSACFQAKKKMFKNTLGAFSFTYSPLDPFFLEVEKDHREDFLIAKPLRALFDLIYVRKKNYQELNDLDNDLRIDLDALSVILKEYSAKDISSLGEGYKKNSTRQLAQILVRNFK